MGIIDRMHRDDAIRQMVELIDRYRIDTVEMFKLKDEIDISGDEPYERHQRGPTPIVMGLQFHGISLTVHFTL